ncbi:MAG: DUF402 domain-containing protein [Anaerolineae bacterium]
MDIIKNDHNGREIWRYPAEVLAQTDNEIRIEAYFNRDDYDAGFVEFKRNDRFVETFYNNRWYNIFAIYDRDDQRLKGWYCNITRPAMWDSAELASDDIALDVWISAENGVPVGDPLVLDHEEFVELGLKPAEMQIALKAVDEIIALAKSNQLPK